MPKEEFCHFAPPGSVECYRKECSKCGWNPPVANARLEAIKEKLAAEEVKDDGKGKAER